MIATDGAVQGLQEANQALFKEYFAAARALMGVEAALATRVTSKALIERHNFLGSVPRMRKTTGLPVQFDDLNRFSLTIANEEWTAGIEIARLDIETDQLGYIQPRISQLALEGARHNTELILNNMASPGLAFDDVAFFADTRVIGDSANIDNKVSVNVTDPAAPTAAEFQTALQQAYQAMVTFQDDKGRPMGLFPDTIVVPPQWLTASWQALNGMLAPGVIATVPPMPTGVLNAGGFKLIVNPFLSLSTHVGYLFHTGQEVKPFLVQELAAPTLGKTDTGSDLWNIHNKIAQVVRKVGNYGIADPRCAIELTLT